MWKPGLALFIFITLAWSVFLEREGRVLHFWLPSGHCSHIILKWSCPCGAERLRQLTISYEIESIFLTSLSGFPESLSQLNFLFFMCTVHYSNWVTYCSPLLYFCAFAGGVFCTWAFTMEPDPSFRYLKCSRKLCHFPACCSPHRKKSAPSHLNSFFPPSQLLLALVP